MNLDELIQAAMNEIGVPQPGYPAPVANAYEHLEAARAIIAKGETWWRCADCKDFSGTPGLCYRNLQRTPFLVIPLDEEAPDD